MCILDGAAVAWSPQLLYLGQHVGVHLALAAWFGASLRAGQVPLITRFAAHVHKELPPALVRYTRQVTLAWVVYFVMMAAVSVALFVWTPLAIWSVFANLLTPIAIGVMFAAEYLLRYRLHPEFERIDPMTAWRAYRDHRDRPPPPAG